MNRLAEQAACFAVVLAITLCGCDQKGNQANNQSSSDSAATKTPVASAESQAKAAPASPATPAAQPAKQSQQNPKTQPIKAATGPRWECAVPTIDFGKVWAGVTIEKTFEFRNVGTQTLQILKAKPRCSCSVASNYTKVVEPGATGLMPFVLKTDNKHGPVNEYLTIDTNDPVRPIMKITLTGHVQTVCELEVVSDYTYDQQVAQFREANDPSVPAPDFPKKKKASFGRIEADDYLSRVIKMRNTSGQPFSLTMNPLPANARFLVEFKETVPGEEFELTISSNGTFPSGYTSLPITFKTNIPEQPYYRVYGHVYVPPRIEIRPTKIVIDPERMGRFDREIHITNNGTTPFEVESIASSEPRFNLRLDPPNPDEPNKHVIYFTVPGKDYRVPEYGELVEIKLTDAETPVIRLEVLPSLKRRATPRPPDKPLTLFPGKMPG